MKICCASSSGENSGVMTDAGRMAVAMLYAAWLGPISAPPLARNYSRNHLIMYLSLISVLARVPGMVAWRRLAFMREAAGNRAASLYYSYMAHRAMPGMRVYQCKQPRNATHEEAKA